MGLQFGLLRADHLSVTDDGADRERATADREQTVHNVLRYLINQHPEAAAAGFAEDGSRVRLPDHPDLRSFTRVPVPAERDNFVSLVVPADRMAVVEVWERGLEHGVSDTTVHLMEDPDRRVQVIVLDTRSRFGVRLGIVYEIDEPADDEAPAFTVTPVVQRPRTATMRKGSRGTITGIDDRVTRMLGFTPESMVGHRSLDFIHPDDHDRAVASFLEMYSTQNPVRNRLRHATASGEWLWLEVEQTYHPAADPEAVVVVTGLTDISDEMAMHEELDKREKLFRRLAESLPIGLVQIDRDRSIRYANARAGLILGAGDDAATLDDLFTNLAPGDRPEFDDAFALMLGTGLDQHLEIQVLLPDSGSRSARQLRHCRLTLTALSDREGAPGAIVTVVDDTDGVRMREELTVQATRDALTGCFNRAATMAHLARVLESDDPVAVVFIDLNGFKRVNDELGHSAGDQILVHAAGRLAAALRNDDIVGRLGGDEFLVVCRHVPDAHEALLVAERLRESLFDDVRVEGTDVAVRGSLGVALSTPGIAVDELVARADAAMYESKRTDDHRPVLHTS
jgi:diguanylate cyclase (GGDEF)-like protein/PAS domain S-box-containing protein